MPGANYFSQDTILALATPLGGALALLRISGTRAVACVAALARDVPVERLAARTLTRCKLSEPGDPAGRIIEDALICVFRAPQSYTGEDVIELSLHGGRTGVELVMDALMAQGARPALPGEFSFRAVRNGKLTLSQAQSVVDLIQAPNREAVALALEKLSGAQNAQVASLSSELKTLATLAAVGIDFSDQDLDEVSLTTLKKRISALDLTLARLEASFDRGAKIQGGLSLALLGLPNAGKSSLFNALLGEDRSIVTEVAGTTRDVVRESLKLGSVSLKLSDTAGIRDTSDQVEAMGVGRTWGAARDADLVILVVDVSTWSADESAVHAIAKSLPTHFWVVYNKIDLTPINMPSLGQSPDEVWVVSSHTLQGIAELKTALAAHCSRLTHRDPGEWLLTRLDHYQGVTLAREHLQRALATTELDLFAADIRHALNALESLIGEMPSDDLLTRIFSDFCIGK